jgi:hypothetical protein
MGTTNPIQESNITQKRTENNQKQTVSIPNLKSKELNSHSKHERIPKMTSQITKTHYDKQSTQFYSTNKDFDCTQI